MSLLSPCVRARGLPPSTVMVYMCDRPSGRESKAICLPSGDQSGLPVSEASNDVNFSGTEPSACATQISCVPLRCDWKAIRLPSGEKRGAESSCVDDHKRVTESFAVRFTRTMLHFAELCA